MLAQPGHEKNPTFKTLAAAMLAAMVVTPALAQAVIQEPGLGLSSTCLIRNRVRNVSVDSRLAEMAGDHHIW
jgi:hypothetical protein